MNLLFYAAAGLCFFTVLLATGTRVFGAILGSPMRGAAVPLLVIPLASDWLRFLIKISPTAALAISLALYLVFAAGFFLSFRPRGPFDAAPERRRAWFCCLVFFIVAHVILRTWLFTGRVENPADDNGAGTKVNAVVHSISWPIKHWEAPELPMSYYYYAYEWPAAFSSWAGIPLKAGFWATAVMLVVVGGMLILELILPRLRTRRDLILGSLVVLNGCTVSFLIALAVRAPPKDWDQEQGLIAKRFGLYLRVPQTTAEYWDPYIILTTGVLIVAVVFLWRLIEKRKLERHEAVFIVLALASLAGYCTFHLIGLALIILPVLCVVAIAIQRGAALRHWFLPLFALGVASLLLSFPIISQLIHRAPGAREERFRDPLYIWLPHALEQHEFKVIAALALLALLSTALSNLLVWPVFFRGNREPLPAYTKCLLGLFFFGAFVGYFGIIDDFVPKFGDFVATAGILAFYTLEKPPKWSFPLMACGVVVPCFLFLDIVHANTTKQKQDPIWLTLDKIDAQTHEVVLYDVPLSVKSIRIPWENLAPYWSRIQFLVPAEDMDFTGLTYLDDPAELKSLPPTQVRLRELAKGAPTYLLLRTADAPPAGERLYTSGLFSLDRVKLQ